MRRIVLILAAACCLAACGSRPVRTADAGTEAADLPRVYLPPEPPAQLTPEGRRDYLRLHYWDGFDFADTLFLARADTSGMFETFARYVMVLSDRPADPVPMDSLMRRAAAPAVAADDEFSCGPIALTVSSHDVSVDGENVALTLKEFDLLRTLMQNEGHVLSRRQLLEDVWGMTYVGETRTVDVHIQTLRQKLAAAVEGADAYIQTVRGVGYCVKQP